MVSNSLCPVVILPQPKFNQSHFWKSKNLWIPQFPTPYIKATILFVWSGYVLQVQFSLTYQTVNSAVCLFVFRYYMVASSFNIGNIYFSQLRENAYKVHTIPLLWNSYLVQHLLMGNSMWVLIFLSEEEDWQAGLFIDPLLWSLRHRMMAWQFAPGHTAGWWCLLVIVNNPVMPPTQPWF